MAETVFGNIIQFFDKIGIYDVVLPFLLVFTLVFAILEKTKVFGLETIKGEKYTRKNLNAMVAFVVGFMTVASARLVEIITKVSSQMVVLLIASVFFLVLVGSFHPQFKKGIFLTKGWRGLFMVIMFIGLLLIFLQAIPTKSGQPWLEWFIEYLGVNWTSTGVASILLMIGVVIVVYFIVKSPSTAPEDKDKKEDEGAGEIEQTE